MKTQEHAPDPFVIEVEASPGIKIAPLEELRIPRKIKKRIKKSRYKMIKIKCWRNTVTNKVFFDLFFTNTVKELHDLQHS